MAFAERLAHRAGAPMQCLFYGSNLRTGSLDGVLDFYLLLPGRQKERIWPRVAYHEWTFRRRNAPRQDCHDVAGPVRTGLQGADAGHYDLDAVRSAKRACLEAHRERHVGVVTSAVRDAVLTATGLACALGPDRGKPDAYWRALFRATYRAELRVEKEGREDSILSADPDHFAGLLTAGWEAQDICFECLERR